MHALLLVLQMCAAGLCSQATQAALDLAYHNCGGNYECMAASLETGKIEQTQSGVTILRGPSR